MRQEEEEDRPFVRLNETQLLSVSWIKLQNLQYVHPAVFKLIMTNAKEIIAVYLQMQ
jgi:hypothetical protein